MGLALNDLLAKRLEKKHNDIFADDIFTTMEEKDDVIQGREF